MADKKYIYAVARIRVLELALLNDSFVEQLIACPDQESAQRLLQEKGWEENLTKEENKIWDTVKELGVPMKIFDVLALPELYHNLKAGIKEVADPDDNPEAFYDNELGWKKITKIIESRDFRALPEHMRKVAEEAYDTFLHTQDGQLCDIMVDRACLMAIRQAGRDSGEPIVDAYAEACVDAANMKIAARCARTGKSADFAKKALAPCDEIDVNRLAAAVPGGIEQVIEYLRKISFHEAADELSKSLSAFECWGDNWLIRKLKPMKADAFSVGPLFAYVIARQNEIKTVRIILSGKANGLSNDSIRERVREMYG